MLALSSSNSFNLYVPPTDMRKSFDSLCGRSELTSDSIDVCVYIFVNKPRKKNKLLHWQSGGFIH